MKQYQRTVTEARAWKLSEDNGWTNYTTQLNKLNEEVKELNECISDEERLEELADIETVLNSIRHILGYKSDQKYPYTSAQLLDIAIDKNTKRITDPNYMR